MDAASDRAHVVAWLRAGGKLTLPAGPPTGVLVLRGIGHRFEDVVLVLAEDAAGKKTAAPAGPPRRTPRRSTGCSTGAGRPSRRHLLRRQSGSATAGR
ncbi:hypothetical protein QEZ40_000435 [Streptomyces katrae]|uniref:Uncharacterized protein n=1 Tax=Streptomyces katrae TaxID=68223 RepID=A0ABT7GT56_9ACTN|nr:hypothetical protein [Streptomyces katrae]MDK9496095.1 hypothetical protein [Streptomyces katrae]